MESSNACSWNTTANIVGVNTFTSILLIISIAGVISAIMFFNRGMRK